MMRMFGTRLDSGTRGLLEALARKRRCSPALLAREVLTEALHEAVIAIAGGPSVPRWLLARAIRRADALPSGAARRVLLRAVARYVHTLARQPGGPDREDRRLLAELDTLFTDAVDQQHVQAAIRDLTAPGTRSSR